MQRAYPVGTPTVPHSELPTPRQQRQAFPRHLDAGQPLAKSAAWLRRIERFVSSVCHVADYHQMAAVITLSSLGLKDLESHQFRIQQYSGSRVQQLRL